MTVNVDTSDGLVNGATGVPKEIGFSMSNTANILWIQFSFIEPFVPLLSAQDSASAEELRELRSAKLLNTHSEPSCFP